jgi:signal transduction histidine kinase
MEIAPARLLLQLPTERLVSLPVPRRACLGLTRAVVFVTRQLASGRPGGISDRIAGDDWRDACWRLGGTSPSVAVWLVTAERRLAAAAAGQAAPSPLRRWLEGLRAALVIPGSPEGTVRLRAALPVPEAVVNSLARGHYHETVDPSGGVVSRAVAGGWLEQLARWSTKPEAAACTPGRSAGGAARGADADPAAMLLEEALLGATAVEGLASDFEARVATARLDSIRELAYGAGHEINNPLANIAARAQALLPDEENPERRRRLATIVDQAFRARDMIGGLMIFARPPRPQPVATPVATLIANVVDSLGPAADQHGVRLVVSPPPTPLTVLVDGSQVEDSLRAVVLNGIEAIVGGGTVIIEVTVADAADGNSCLITVIDNGAGMSRETVERVFDPFFSGREAGRGIGLGLSKALRLIDANGGRMTVASRPQQGTTVAVRLPLAAERQ